MEEMISGKCYPEMTLMINQNYLVNNFFLQDQTNTYHLNTLYCPLVTHHTSTLDHLSSTSYLPHY